MIFRACLFGPEMPAGRPIGGLPERGVNVRIYAASPRGLRLFLLLIVLLRLLAEVCVVLVNDSVAVIAGWFA